MVLADVPPLPGIWKVEASSCNFHSDVPLPRDLKSWSKFKWLPLLMYSPPPKNDKVGCQVKVTLWFLLMYPPHDWNKHECYRKLLGSASTFYQYTPPPLYCIHTSLVCGIRWKENISFSNSAGILGQHDIVVLADVPSPPFQYDYLILCLNKKLVNFNFKWIWISGLELHPPLLSSQTNEMLVFGLRSTSDDQPGWLMDSNPIHHLSPAQKVKCSFLDYVQLLMIGQAGWWTRTPSATPLQQRK